MENKNFENKNYQKNKKLIEEQDEKVYYQDYADIRYKIGMKVRLDFTGLSHEALGIAKINGITEDGQELVNYPIFVSGVLPEEKAIVEITDLRKTYGKARLIDIRYHNYDIRVTPICPSFQSCGGCNLMHMNYEAQLAFKKQTIIDTFAHLGGIENLEIDDVVGMDEPYHYRNKVQVPYHFIKSKTICGFYQKNTHQVVSLADCYIQSSLSSDIVKFIRNLANELKIKGYEEESHTGLLRHVIVRENKKQDEVMIVMVTNEKKIPNQDILINKIIKRYPVVISIVQSINCKIGNVILGDENILLFGKPYIMDELLGVKFQIGPKSFYQVNSKQTEKLYKLALEKANLQRSDILIDAYCGIGTIGLIASQYVKKVYGVEIVEEAIQDAKTNAKLNNCKNIEFICNKAENQIIKWANAKINADVIIVDPPRKGCEEALLQTISDMKIPKMIYVSCNPATLARDVKYMLNHDYIIKSVTPVDMFANSNHIETVVLLEK